MDCCKRCLITGRARRGASPPPFTHGRLAVPRHAAPICRVCQAPHESDWGTPFNLFHVLSPESARTTRKAHRATTVRCNSRSPVPLNTQYDQCCMTHGATPPPPLAFIHYTLRGHRRSRRANIPLCSAKARHGVRRRFEQAVGAAVGIMYFVEPSPAQIGETWSQGESRHRHVAQSVSIPLVGPRALPSWTQGPIR